MGEPAAIGPDALATVRRVATAHAKSGASKDAIARQTRREELARLERMRRAARDPALGLPQGPTMLARALSRPSSPVADRIRAVYAFARGDRPRVAALFLGSPPGSGKTTAAVEVILTHVERGQSAAYMRAPLLPAIRNHATAALYDRARDADLLFVDELGMEPEPAVVTALLLERHDNERVTILVGNLTHEEMVARYALRDDPRMLSRLRGIVKSGLREVVVAIESRDFRAGGR